MRPRFSVTLRDLFTTRSAVCRTVLVFPELTILDIEVVRLELMFRLVSTARNSLSLLLFVFIAIHQAV